MVKLSDLNPNERACMLVGLYLQHWSMMEVQLNRAIHKALGLDKLQGAILCSNIQLRDKLHTLMAAAELEIPKNSPEFKQYKKVLTAIGEKSPERNMIAHDAFTPNEKKTGVIWHSIRAKGSLTFPDNSWEPSDFFDRFKKIDGWHEKLEELESNITRRKLARALASTSQPRLGLFGLASLGLPSPHSQELRNYGGLLSIPQTGMQIPPFPEKKG